MRKNYYLPTLDGWRAIAITMVMIYHGFWQTLGPLSPGYDPKSWQWFELGKLGVNLFFCISGYLISSRILEEHDRFGNFSIRDFYIKRFFRIIPPFYFFLAALFFLSLTGAAISMKELLSSAAFVRIFYSEGMSWYTAHVWSLCIEEQFYIFASLLFFFLRPRLVFNVIILGFMVSLASEKAHFYLTQHADSANSQSGANIVLLNFLKIAYEMAFMFTGVAMSFLARGSHWKTLLSYFNPLVQFFFFVLLVFGTAMNWPLKYIYLPILFAVAMGITSTLKKSILFAILESTPLRFLGRISYSLYLWQQLFFVPPQTPVVVFSFLQKAPYNIFAIFILATLSHYFIEKPLISIGKRFLKHPL